MKLWLIGMMGTGKTTAGRIAASQLDVEFRDTDDMLVRRSGQAISDIWDDFGEEAFRELERIVIAGLDGVTGVVATGGGAVLDPANRELMAGPVVWLRATPDTIARRIAESGGRPLVVGANPVENTIRDLLQAREGIYRSLATEIIDTDEIEIEDVAQRIVGLWPS